MSVANIKIATFNCKGYINNKDYILKLIKTNDICFLTETWTGWDPDTMCDIKLANRHIYTTSRKRQGVRNGRHSCMSAFVINDTIKSKIKLEHVNRRISILKVNLYDKPTDKFRGYALIGTYMSSNNNANNEYELDLAIISTTYERLFREGYKSIIIGDLNADSSRLKYTTDRILKKWLNRKNFTEVSRLYTQAIPNTFLNSRGQHSWIDHILIGDVPWPEITQVNIKVTDMEKKNLRDSASWKTSIKGC
jgi:exonuclease III